MLKLKCRNCKVVLLEAEERWSRVAKTGMCPECSWFYDEGKELEAQRIANDPAIISTTRKAKLQEMTVGAIMTVVALTGVAFFVLAARATGILVIYLGLGGLLIFGLRMLLHGLLYDARREARSRIARPTDLRALAERQEAAGAFADGRAQRARISTAR